MTEQSDTEVPQPVQPQPSQPNPECSPGQAAATAMRLKHVFDMVADILSGERVGRIWVVYGVDGGVAPCVNAIDDKDGLCVLISELRARHNAEPDNDYYIHIFYGQRWQIQKGRTWKLWDGRTLEPVTVTDVEEFFDHSGGLGDRRDLDDVVPASAVIADPSEEAAEEEEEASEVDVRAEPPMLGEQSAPPGEDPAVE